MPIVIEWRGTREELYQRLRQLPAVLSGGAPDPDSAAAGLLLADGLTLLGKIQEAYDLKSQGQQDAMGITWPPAAATTLALRNKVTTRKALNRIARTFHSMPPHRQRQIRTHYRRLLDLYQSGSGAGALARKHALSLLQRMQPLISPTRYKRLYSELSKPVTGDRAMKLALAGAVHLLLRDTNRMFNSLSPRIDSPDRVLRVVPGAVNVGSNVDYFKYHQSRRPRKLKADGTPKLPRRQILPDDHTPIPPEWQRAVMDTTRDGLRGREFWQKFLGSQATVA